ncbi:C1 family peptidase [Oceaniglobus trochenteri]|uniref:C1 family peptidase n=1 Tax=Oceaniglobus trochenteri TaxID=2763260 RepID=UPI001CFF62D3|nr:C1 family peptidase [Oceaniglobus trochenteri]
MRISKSIQIAGLLTALSVAPVAAQFLGAVIDEDAFAATPKAPPLSRGSYDTLPPRASLKAFAPRPGDQGNQGSCVGWATAYAARTILAGAHGSPADNGQAFSPAYVYNQIRVDDCDGGSKLSDAMRLLSGDGVPPLAAFPYDENSCSRLPDSSQRRLAEQFRIGEWRRLFDITAVNKHVPVRRALAAGFPVPIAMMLPNSFMQYEGGVFRATSAERRAFLSDDRRAFETHIAGGHAMTAIGYDDDGEWIEVINSWSRNWGENGYVRISWDTFNTFTVEAYEVMPQPAPAPPPAPVEPQPAPPKPQPAPPEPAPKPQPAPKPRPAPVVHEMQGALRFIDLQGDEIGARPDAAGWVLSRALPSGARFRVEATPGTSASIYVLGAGGDGRFVELFPRSQRVSTRVGAGDTLLLPGPSEDHFTQLDQSPGQDTYLVLVSRRSLELGPVLRAFDDMIGRPLADRLEAALGPRLVDASNVRPAPSGIGFEAAFQGGDVIAMPVRIDHVTAGPGTADRNAPRIVLTTPSRDGFDAAADAPFVVASRDVTIEGRAQDENRIARLTIDGAQSMRHSDRGPFQAQITLPPGDGPHAIAITATDVADNTTTETLWFQLRN